jgi:hypothetical protein
MEEVMKRLILATVSALALGLGGMGAAYAQGYSGTAMGPNSANGNAANTGEAYALVTPGQVAQAQQELTRAGDYNGPINGVLDAMTSDALLRYQEQRGLPDTGGFNPPTIASLGLSTAPPYTYERTGYGYAAGGYGGTPGVGYGSSGPYSENSGAGYGHGNANYGFAQAQRELSQYGLTDIRNLHPTRGWTADAMKNGQDVHIILGENGMIATFRGD